MKIRHVVQDLKREQWYKFLKNDFLFKVYILFVKICADSPVYHLSYMGGLSGSLVHKCAQLETQYQDCVQ